MEEFEKVGGARKKTVYYGDVALIVRCYVTSREREVKGRTSINRERIFTPCYCWCFIAIIIVIIIVIVCFLFTSFCTKYHSFNTLAFVSFNATLKDFLLINVSRIASF